MAKICVLSFWAGSDCAQVYAEGVSVTALTPGRVPYTIRLLPLRSAWKQKGDVPPPHQSDANVL